MIIKSAVDVQFEVNTQARRVLEKRNKEKLNRKYVEKLVEIHHQSAFDVNEVGFIARFLIQATLPHSMPRLNEWGRKNGNLTMHMMSPSAVGLPYGCYARLILVWISTQAIRNKAKFDKGLITEQESRRLELGRSQRRFMEALGLRSSGGKNGTIAPLREQMRRLFKTTISIRLSEINEEDGDIFEKEIGARVAEVSHIWWNTKYPDRDLLNQSWVELSPKFFQIITDRPVPLDMRVLRLIKRSPMAFDIYCWATYRVSYLKRTTIIPWAGLVEQIGSNYSDDRDFMRRFSDGLVKVKQAWPGLDATPTEKGLLIKPGAPQVPRRTKYRSD